MGPVQVTMGNGLTEINAYTNRGALSQSKVGVGCTLDPFDCTTVRYRLSLGYAPNGNVTSSNDSVNGNWTSYTYDAFNRLSTSSRDNGQQAFSYVYDRFGNRWQQNVTAGQGPAPQYTFNANNRISSSGIVYDAAGNVTNDGLHTYTYDAEGRVTAVDNGGTASYVYDAQSRRVKAAAGFAARNYVYDLAGRAITVVDGTGALLRGEFWAGSRHLATYTSTATYFAHGDWLGTERKRTDISGADVTGESFTSLPFGDALSGQGASPIHFTGQERDPDTESGLDHFWLRNYSSTQGRWLSPDPAGLAAVDITDPQSLNRYAYARNQPLDMIDPLGLCDRAVAAGRPCDDPGSGGGGSITCFLDGGIIPCGNEVPEGMGYPLGGGVRLVPGPSTWVQGTPGEVKVVGDAIVIIDEGTGHWETTWIQVPAPSINIATRDPGSGLPANNATNICGDFICDSSDLPPVFVPVIMRVPAGGTA
jgi:RHS repeat-associated protein